MKVDYLFEEELGGCDGLCGDMRACGGLAMPIIAGIVPLGLGQ